MWSQRKVDAINAVALGLRPQAALHWPQGSLHGHVGQVRISDEQQGKGVVWSFNRWHSVHLGPKIPKEFLAGSYSPGR